MAATMQSSNVARSDPALEMPVLPSMIKMIMCVPVPGMVSHPAVILSVHVRSLRDVLADHYIFGVRCPAVDIEGPAHELAPDRGRGYGRSQLRARRQTRLAPVLGARVLAPIA